MPRIVLDCWCEWCTKPMSTAEYVADAHGLCRECKALLHR
jgi:hypothetical protein